MEKKGRLRKNTTKDDENNPNVFEQNTTSGDGAHEEEQISLNEIKDFRQDSHKQLQDIKQELNKSNKRIGWK